ncbi:MAG: YitT family protein [Firmicutes bacterium]|nr:YitT family protein [Bacillota bacterium]
MGLLDLFKKEKISKQIAKKNKVIRILIYIICVIITALIYNVFFVPNNIITGGMGGIAIVLNKLTGLSTGVFLLLSNIVLLIINYFLLGIESTKKNAACAIFYPIVVSILEPMTKNIQISFDSYLFTVLVSIIIYSIPLGIIYKIGYNTGGSDIINEIICTLKKTSVGQASNYINISIILASAFILGIPVCIYGIFALLLCNVIVDFIILGNSDSKLCIIKTKNIKYLEDFLLNDFNIGYSLLETKGGIDRKKRKTIMCIVSSREYYRFKNLIMDIDPNAFFITHDCYEVLGGTNKRIKI